MIRQRSYRWQIIYSAHVNEDGPAGAHVQFAEWTGKAVRQDLFRVCGRAVERVTLLGFCEAFGEAEVVAHESRVGAEFIPKGHGALARSVREPESTAPIELGVYNLRALVLRRGRLVP